MKRIGIIGLCFAAVLAFSVVAVGSASASEVLFSSATGTFEAKGGSAELNGASKVECLTTTSTGTIETKHLGKLKVTFEKCSTLFFGNRKECTGTKPASGTKGNIIFEGPFHLGLSRKVSTEAGHAAILVLATPATEFECTEVGTVKVTGSVIGLLQTKAGTPLEPGGGLLNSLTVFKGPGTKQEDKEFLLSLTTPPEELMAKQELSSEIFGIKGESAEIASGEITKVSEAGVHLEAG